MGRIGTVLLGMSILILTSGCGRNLKVKKDCPCGFYTSDSGKILAWPDGDSVNFVFEKSFPKELRFAVASAAENYNHLLDKTHLALSPTDESAPAMKDINPDSVSSDGINGVYWVPEPWPWKDKDPNSDAMTVVVFKRGRIVEADLFFRERSFQGPIQIPNEASFSSIMNSKPTSLLTDAGSITTSTVADPAEITQGASSNVKWIYTIGVHEFGHALGRVHTDREDSIMHPTVSLESIKRPFTDWDVETFNHVYHVTDTTNATTN